MMKAAEFLRERKNERTENPLIFLLSQMKYVFLLPARTSAFWRATGENCARHIWHSFIMWSCWFISDMGIMCLTLSWYAIKADESGNHRRAPRRENIYSLLLCLHYQQKKKNRRDNFLDVEAGVRRAWCFRQIFTYSSSASAAASVNFLLLCCSFYDFVMKCSGGRFVLPSSGRWKLFFLADFVLNGFL